jgi:uncharacterized membrane protein
MTPGNKLGSQKPAATDTTGGKRARIIPVGPARDNAVPGGASTGSAAPKTSPNDYTFCNQTSYVLSIAVGLQTGAMVFTRGWWPIPSGECKVVIKGPLNQPVYYSFARSSYAHNGPIRTWGGTHDLCTGKMNFQASSSEGAPCGPGYVPQGFASVDTQGKSGWLTVLTEGSQFKSLPEARIAGMKRLLSDVGLFDGPIDGASGPKFTDAMNQARTALGAPGADTSVLFSKLHSEAIKLQTSAGLTFCNRTQSIIWTAYGRESQGRAQSRGWYRLMPETCEKVVRERLTEPFIYAFASAEKPEGTGVAESWGGTKIFCTKDASFDFEDSTNCGGRGSSSTGFFQINTNGQPSITFEFVPRADPATDPSAEAPAQ